MSIMGTSIAAGVAQTAHNAQQVAREQDKRRGDAARASREVRDRYEHLIQGLEEGDEAGTAARVTIDDQVPDHPPEHSPPEHAPEHAPEDAPESSASHGRTGEARGDHAPFDPLTPLTASFEAQALRQRLLGQHRPRDGALYQHLDVEA